MTSLRRLLETELTVANDNNTYPNATVNVGLSRPQGCVPWWTKTRSTDVVCPKDCQLSGFKEGYNLGQLAPLYIKVEKGSVSRVAPRPLKGAYMNITGISKIDNRVDYKFQVSDYGVNFVQFAANYNVGAKFTVSMGLLKKNPNAGGSAVPDPNAKHNPFCYFNVTWTVVAPGTIPTAADAAKPAATSAATSSATSAADNGDLPSTDTTPEVAAAATVPKKAAAPAPAAAQPTVAGKKAAAPAPSAGSAFEDLGGGL